MTFRRRLLAASMLTLVVGLGALLVVGNVVLGVSANNDQMRLLQTRVDAEIAALDRARRARRGPQQPRRPVPRPRGVDLRRPAGHRAPGGGDPAVNRVAMRLGRAGRPAGARCGGRRGDPRRACDLRRQAGRDRGRGDVGRGGRAPAALRPARLDRARRAPPAGGMARDPRGGGRRAAAGGGDDARRGRVERERPRPALRPRAAARRAHRAGGDAGQPARADRGLAPSRAAVRQRDGARAAHADRADARPGGAGAAGRPGRGRGAGRGAGVGGRRGRPPDPGDRRAAGGRAA